MKVVYLVVLTIVCGACASAPCALPSPVELWSEGPADQPGSSRLARFDLDDQPLWSGASLPASPRLERVERAVRAQVPDVSQRVLIDEALAHQPDLATRENLLQARTSADGPQARITPMRCLEGVIFDDQMGRLDMATSPSEVLAFILRRGRDLRVYTYTVNMAGIGGVGRVRPTVEADITAGWALDVVLHNHNFFLDRGHATPGQVDLGVGGVVAPSAPDVQLLRAMRDELGMREAWITNGFHTGHWGGADLERMRAPDEP